MIHAWLNFALGFLSLDYSPDIEYFSANEENFSCALKIFTVDTFPKNYAILQYYRAEFYSNYFFDFQKVKIGKCAIDAFQKTKSIPSFESDPRNLTSVKSMLSEITQQIADIQQSHRMEKERTTQFNTGFLDLQKYFSNGFPKNKAESNHKNG